MQTRLSDLTKETKAVSAQEDKYFHLPQQILCTVGRAFEKNK